MVKILVIGDFHGKFTDKLLKRIKKEKFDLIISPGDFCGSKELGKLFFKYSYGSDKELWEFIGKKKFKELEKQNFDAGIFVLKKLNSFNVPVITVTGNWDPTSNAEIGYDKVKEPQEKKFNSVIKKLKNIYFIDYKNINFFGINFVGYPRSTYPGFIDKNRKKRLFENYGKEGNKIIKKTNEDNKKYFKRFKILFKNFSNKTIFISHNCPYNSKLDIIKHGPQKGKHYGSWLTQEIILKLKPRLVICGHMHENKGFQKIGRSFVINSGAALEGRTAIVLYPEDKKGKIKVKWIR